MKVTIFILVGGGGAARPEFKIGKLDENKITIDNRNIESWKNHSVENIVECKKCKYKFNCGGGCVFKAFEKNKTINSGNCADFYELIKAYLILYLSRKSLNVSFEFIKFKFLKKFISDQKVLFISANGDSMKPTIKSATIVKICYKQDYEKDDVVLYESGGNLKLHRIVDIDNNGYIKLKGDNEDFIETNHKSSILGAVGDLNFDPVSIIYEKKIEKNILKIIIKNNYLESIEVKNV